MGSAIVTVRVILAGGLGNQLFQFSAGWHVARDGELILETGILTPNAEAKTEIAKLNLPKNIVIRDSSQRSKSEKRLISYCIRSSSKLQNNFNHKMVEVAASLVLSFFRLRKTKVFLNNGLGFDSRIEHLKGDVMLIGYFQCYHWATAIKPKLNTCLKDIRKLDDIHNSILEIAQPFNMMHLRLGDYLQESKFGIPSEKYYLSSLNELGADANLSINVVLFTDSPEIVEKYLPNLLNSSTLFSPPRNFEALENMIVMSSAENFIISNSTYSWWAAFLSFHSNPKVYAPAPWFHDLEVPVGLIPKNWITVTSGLGV
jgi:hypothetical protein